VSITRYRKPIAEETCFDLTIEDLGTLIGMVIGDGHIIRHRSQSKNKTNFVGHATLSLDHCGAQEDYVLHKAKRLHDILGGSKPNIYRYSRKDGRTNVIVKKTHPIFTHLWEILYPQGKKFWATSDVLDLLTPEGLAYIFMDDGSVSHGKYSSAYSIYTCVPEAENQVLIDCIESKTGSRFLQHRFVQTDTKYLCRAASKLEGFKALIAPYILPSMNYKFICKGESCENV
jgi:hypothetical protein